METNVLSHHYPALLNLYQFSHTLNFKMFLLFPSTYPSYKQLFSGTNRENFLFLCFTHAGLLMNELFSSVMLFPSFSLSVCNDLPPLSPWHGLTASGLCPSRSNIISGFHPLPRASTASFPFSLSDKQVDTV